RLRRARGSRARRDGGAGQRRLRGPVARALRARLAGGRRLHGGDRPRGRRGGHPRLRRRLPDHSAGARLPPAHDRSLTMRRPAPLPAPSEREGAEAGAAGQRSRWSRRRPETGRRPLAAEASAVDAAAEAAGEGRPVAGKSDAGAVTAAIADLPMQLPPAAGAPFAARADGDGSTGPGAGTGCTTQAPVRSVDVWRAARARRKALRAEIRRFTQRSRRRRIVWWSALGAVVALVIGSVIAAYSPLFAVERITVA